MPQKDDISSRKAPKQARSNDLVAAILDAAIQVLMTEGASRFTTARVAERAGVSVGSLYQYFPNKAAILFRLQSDEWRQTIALLVGIVQNRTFSPLDRLRSLVHAFVRSECEEAVVRRALADAAPLYRDAPEAMEAKAAGKQAFDDFVAELLPDANDAERRLRGDLVERTLSSVGASYSETERTPAEIEAFAEALADMLCGYLDEWRERPRRQRLSAP